MPFATLTFLIKKACHQFSDKHSIQFYRKGVVETQLTYNQLDRETSQMAHYFISKGIKKKDRVILLLEKSLVFVTVHLALQKIGAVSVPLNPGFKASEIAYFLEDASPAIVVAGIEQGRIVRDVNPQTRLVTIDLDIPYPQLSFFRSHSTECPDVDHDPSDPGLIIYTSGTTGKPKGAVLTQENLCQDVQNIIETWAITTDDVLCHTLPLFHIHGLCFALHTCLAAGARVLMLDAFDAPAVLTVLAARTGPDVCTLFMAVPTMYNLLIRHMGDPGYDFNHLRLITSGSAPLLIKDFKRITHLFGREPVEREGMSETGMNFSNPLNGVKKPGSIGLPMPQLKVRVVDPVTVKDVEPGKIGEFWLKSPVITPGYWLKPEETQKTFEAGWFKTGDLGYMDEDGYYFLTDRIKHIIISGGENISPKEIELVINQMQAVAASTVVGIKDHKWGETVVAAIVLKKNGAISGQEVLDHCKAHLHSWKCPRQVIFVDALPKNTMGKVLTDDVRRLF